MPHKIYVLQVKHLLFQNSEKDILAGSPGYQNNLGKCAKIKTWVPLQPSYSLLSLKASETQGIQQDMNFTAVCPQAEIYMKSCDFHLIGDIQGKSFHRNRTHILQKPFK